MAVDTGYWPLYRYQPASSLAAAAPADGAAAPAEQPHRGVLTLDSKKLKGDLESFLSRENRFAILTRKDPAAADALHHQLDDNIHLRHERLQRMAADSKKVTPPPAGGAAPPAAE